VWRTPSGCSICVLAVILYIFGMLKSVLDPCMVVPNFITLNLNFSSMIMVEGRKGRKTFLDGRMCIYIVYIVRCSICMLAVIWYIFLHAKNCSWRMDDCVKLMDYNLNFWSMKCDEGRMEGFFLVWPYVWIFGLLWFNSWVVFIVTWLYMLKMNFKNVGWIFNMLAEW
jgi:hypothetical protein